MWQEQSRPFVCRSTISVYSFTLVTVSNSPPPTFPWFKTHLPFLVLRELPPYEVVHPARVDARGHFLSNFLSHHARRVHRREAAERSADLDRIFYQLRHSDRSLRLNLTLNPYLLAPGFVTERRYGGLQGARIRALPRSSHCHLLGEVWDEATVKGSAAISTCDGLVSYEFAKPDAICKGHRTYHAFHLLSWK